MNKIMNLYNSLDPVKQAWVSTIFRYGGIVIGFKIMKSMLLEYNTSICILAGFLLLTGSVFIALGTTLVLIALLTNQYH
jgi:hypothetical protein